MSWGPFLYWKRTFPHVLRPLGIAHAHQGYCEEGGQGSVVLGPWRSIPNCSWGKHRGPSLASSAFLLSSGVAGREHLVPCNVRFPQVWLTSALPLASKRPFTWTWKACSRDSVLQTADCTNSLSCFEGNFMLICLYVWVLKTQKVLSFSLFKMDSELLLRN